MNNNCAADHADHDSHVREWHEQPFENWRFQVVFNATLVGRLLTTMTDMKDRIILIGEALANERKHMAGPFVHYRNGSLNRKDIVFHQLPDRILEIDLFASDNLASLAVLDIQIEARKRCKADPALFKPWSVIGKVRGEDHTVLLVLKNSSLFRLDNCAT